MVRKIPLRELPKFVDITGLAYPGISGAPDWTERTNKRIKNTAQDPSVDFYGCYRDKKMLGGMRIHDFRMNFHGKMIPVSGIGSVAVDLPHKKEKVCKEMVEFYLEHSRKNGFSLAALYPFRTDFYKKMGWGFGTGISKYRFRPHQLPAGGSKKHIVQLHEKDVPKVMECHDHITRTTHGMMLKCGYEKSYYSSYRDKIYGYKDKNKIRGYVVFNFHPVSSDNFILNDLRIFEMFYENRDIFFELIAFLRSQQDQINFIEWPILDPDLYHLFDNPQNDSPVMVHPVYHESSAQGVGLMYRVVDTNLLFDQFKDYDFNGQSLKMKLKIEDNFFKSNQGSYFLEFDNGRVEMKKRFKPDVEISMGVAAFSSMIMGVVPFRKIREYRQAEISDMKFLDRVNRIFTFPAKPVCNTMF